MIAEPGSAAAVTAAVADAFREEWGQVVATLIGATGDWDLAEECAQEAFAAALARWGQDGVPRLPGAWLTTVARNRMRDRLRRAATEDRKLAEIAMSTEHEGPDDLVEADGIPDDRLRLMFTCCHPALGPEARVALTLRTLTGLTTAEIAAAFLVGEPTMAQRLVRAKRKIRNAGIPYRVPSTRLLPERTAGILAVLYLLFTRGYRAGDGENLLRLDLSDEAIRLARVLARLLPDSGEALGLLALMLLHDARRPARLDQAGELVPLEDQHRGRWDATQIEEGIAALDAAARLGPAGAFVLQAEIAARHAIAVTAAETDWDGIAGLYGDLAAIVASPVVELNRAVAVAMADGPTAGLGLVDALDAEGDLAGYHLLPATQADLLRRLDRHAEAAEAYRAALELLDGEGAERRYLERRLAESSGRSARPVVDSR